MHSRLISPEVTSKVLYRSIMGRRLSDRSYWGSRTRGATGGYGADHMAGGAVVIAKRATRLMLAVTMIQVAAPAASPAAAETLIVQGSTTFNRRDRKSTRLNSSHT